MKQSKYLDCTYWELEERMLMCGTNDKNLHMLCEAFNVEIALYDEGFLLNYDNEEDYFMCAKIIKACHELIAEQKKLNESDVYYLINLVKRNKDVKLEHLSCEPIAKTVSGKLIYPKTIGQRLLVKAMDSKDIVFASGVAGTGKTYLAVVYAVTQLKKGSYTRLILTRPAVEAGENLGFLPGDLKEKVDPYLRPLYDALYDVLGHEQVSKLLEKEVIEIAPLAYMRGRTLDNAFIILDEAQNTTSSQMKMFLTRMGFNSKVVITGDASQIDLAKKSESGLTQAIEILKDIKEIGVVELTSLDVVRHPIVQKILDTYEKYENNTNNTKNNFKRNES